jgi:hypothetical protein
VHEAWFVVDAESEDEALVFIKGDLIDPLVEDVTFHNYDEMEIVEIDEMEFD